MQGYVTCAEFAWTGAEEHAIFQGDIKNISCCESEKNSMLNVSQLVSNSCQKKRKLQAVMISYFSWHKPR